MGRLGWGLALAALLQGCQAAPTCGSVSVWGDPSAAASLAILVRGLDGSFAELSAEGMPAALTFPSQGGHVMFVGARIQNFEACNQDLAARLINPGSGEIFAVERRNVDFSEPTDAGGTPDLVDTSSVANLPACPDASGRDVVDQDWLLEVTVTGKQGRKVSASRHVIPVCAQSDPAARALCNCECRADYFLGKCGHSDAG